VRTKVPNIMKLKHKIPRVPTLYGGEIEDRDNRGIKGRDDGGIKRRDVRVPEETAGRPVLGLRSKVADSRPGRNYTSQDTCDQHDVE